MIGTEITSGIDYSSRLPKAIAEIVQRIELDLVGRHVLTEAATGPYVVTPVIAAYAGAKVVAVTKDTRFGSVATVKRATMDLAGKMGVSDRIEIVEHITDDQIAAADIVTNSGHLRPLDANFVRAMTPGAVVSLMYETWELREGEVDLDACNRNGVIVAGTNEQHPRLRVFDYLGILALKGLFQCGVPPMFSKLLLICDNPFCPFIAKTLVACDSSVDVLGPHYCPNVEGVQKRSVDDPGIYDAVIVADTPVQQPIIGSAGAAKYTLEQLGTFDALVQVWGDVDRRCLGNAMCYPAEAPSPGHMGILLSELGPEPVIRLQAGGLKVGEVVNRRGTIPLGAFEYCQPVLRGESDATRLTVAQNERNRAG